MWLLFSLAPTVGIDITLHEQGESYGSCVHPVHLCHTGDEKCALYTLHTRACAHPMSYVATLGQDLDCPVLWIQL